MKRKLLSVLLALVLVLILGLVTAVPVAALEPATIEVSQPLQLTDSPYNDRNPSFFEASDGAWWVFFARGRLVDPLPANPDVDFFDICYVKSGDDGANWTEEDLPEIPAEHGMGAFTPAAFEDTAGNIWVFYAANTDDVYYFVSVDGGANWAGPTATGFVDVGNHLDAFQTQDGTYWVFFSDVGSTGVFASNSVDGTTWSTPAKISDSALDGGWTPRVIEADGNIYVVYIGSEPLGVYLATYDGSWSHALVINTVNDDYDPLLVKDGETWRLFWGPYIEGDDHQWLMTMSSTDLSTWSEPVYVTAGYGTDKWWDCWPEAAEASIFFYTSMKDGPVRSDMDIWVYNPVDWELTNSHFEAIQPAIDAASEGDIINVAAGTYVEDLDITTDNLELVGTDATLKGIATSTAGDAPGIEILANSVSVHGFTIEAPDRVAGEYFSGVFIDGTDVEIYDNHFVGSPAMQVEELSLMVATYETGFSPTLEPTDVSGLHIHDNVFTGYGDFGASPVYVMSHVGSGSILVDSNTLEGAINIGITVEADNAVVSNNTLSTTLDTETAPYGTYGIRFMEVHGPVIYTNLVASSNDVSGFKRAIRVGNSSAGSTFTATISNNTLDVDNGVSIWGRQGNSVTASGNLLSVVRNDDISVTIDATNNWWGDAVTTTSAIESLISGDVDYSPWLITSPITGTAPDIVASAHPWTWYTNDSIQDAIVAASAEDTINVAAGTYNLTAPIAVNKSVTLTGDTTTPSNVVVNAPTTGIDRDAFQVKADGVTIQGFKIAGAHFDNFGDGWQNAGIMVGNDGSAHGTTLMDDATTYNGLSVTITNNEITDCEYGMYLYEIHDSIITYNNIHDAAHGMDWGGDGIHLFYEGGEDLINNDVSHNDLDNVRHGIIFNSGGFPEGNVITYDFSGNNVEDNTLTNVWNVGIFFQAGSGTESSPITIKDNTLITSTGAKEGDEDNENGLITVYTDWTEITGNTVTASYHHGIWIDGSHHTVTDNTVTSNSKDGIHIGHFKESSTVYGGPLGDLTREDLTIQNNNISGNTGDGLDAVQADAVVDATLNWWGTAIKSQIADLVSDNVDYSPWLDAAYPGGQSTLVDVTSISLESGWNLISLPLIPEDATIANVLSDVEFDKVAYYTGGPYGDWEFYSSATSDLTEMEDGKGYWIVMNTAETLTISGHELCAPPPPPAVPPSYNLVEGWNLIGFKSLNEETNPEEYLGTLVVGTMEAMYGYDTTVGSYIIIVATTNLVPGQGYWLAVNTDGTIYP